MRPSCAYTGTTRSFCRSKPTQGASSEDSRNSRNAPGHGGRHRIEAVYGEIVGSGQALAVPPVRMDVVDRNRALRQLANRRLQTPTVPHIKARRAFRQLFLIIRPCRAVCRLMTAAVVELVAEEAQKRFPARFFLKSAIATGNPPPPPDGAVRFPARQACRRTAASAPFRACRPPSATGSAAQSVGFAISAGSKHRRDAGM